MIRIGQLKLPVEHTPEDILLKALRILKISKEEVLGWEIVKQSVDARKKPDISYVYTIDIKTGPHTRKEAAIVKNIRQAEVVVSPKRKYHFPYSSKESGETLKTKKPVIVGTGPAGLFCAYMLAKHGYRPLVIERGAPVDERINDVEYFWKTGKLNTQSNVQFGEGGAGTFSDGKLNTLVKDRDGRNRAVLEIFTEHGAPASILYESKPHIGTDILSDVVKNIRGSILKYGGEVLFHTEMTDILLEHGKLTGIEVNHERIIPAGTAVLALGHSARDTFEMLYHRQIPMTVKSFAVGVRTEHPQEWINKVQYGEKYAHLLPPSSYKLTAQVESGRGVYTFCMCPGGYVVNASSEPSRLAVNGMSYHKRDSRNANSAVIVTVTPDDFGLDHPLAGMYFQRKLEENAYRAGGGKIPVQRFVDFRNRSSKSTESEKVAPCMKGSYAYADVRSIFPEEIGNALEQGILAFDRKIPGYANPDMLLSGVESRTSSPIRMPRSDRLESGVEGIFPCGEGAGYAGGIMSAAMDGLKTAEAVAEKLK